VICHSGIFRHPSLCYFIYPQTHACQSECLWSTAPPLLQRPRHQEEKTAFVSTQAITVLARLLPDAARMHFDACEVDEATRQITLAVHSTQATAPCPLCTIPAWRIHSPYGRTLADLPWADYRVC